MPDSSSRFIYSFFILFLCILLSMLVMFTVMLRYDRNARTDKGFSTVSGEREDGSEVKGDGVRDLTPLYRANLFTTDLCVIVLAEAALILLFVKFTIPATLIATVVMLFMAANSAEKLRGELIPKFASRFVTNRYATLTHSDLMLLIVLSGLIMAFLVSVLLKQGGIKIGGDLSQSLPSPPGPRAEGTAIPKSETPS